MPGEPRFEFRPSDRRPRIRYWDGSEERYVYTYRLAAVAWGILDGLDDPREVDHAELAHPMVTAEWNLEAVEPETHGRRTRARESARKRRTAVPTQD